MFLISLPKSISCALGALGLEFESPRPDLLFSEGQNPPWEKIGK